MRANRKTRAGLLEENDFLRKKIEVLTAGNKLNINKSDTLALRQAIEQCKVAFLVTDPDGRIEYVNPYFTLLTGYSLDELIGENPKIVGSKYHSKEFYEGLWDTIKSGKTWEGEFLNKKKNGELYWESATIGPVTNEKGEIIRFVSAKVDITEKKHAQEKQRRKEAEITSIYRSAPIGIGMVKNRIILYANDTLCEIVGYTFDEIKGKNSMMLYENDEEYERVGSEKYSQIEKDGVGRVKTRFKCKDGRIKTVLLSSSPINPDDLSEGVTFSVLDLTDWKRTEAYLKESEEKFRQLAEKSPNMIFINQREKIVYANKMCEELTGYSKKEFYAPDFDFKILIQPEYLELLMKNFKAHMEGTDVPPYEYALRTKTGQRIESIISTKLIRYGEDQAILGIVTDISKQKRTEEKVRQSEKDYRTLFEEAHESIFVFTPEGEIILDVNQQACKVYGFDREELIGMSLKELSKDVAKGEENIKKTLESGTYRHFETVHFTKEQVELIMEINASVVEYSGQKAILSINRDITERRRAERALWDSEEKFRNLFDYSNDSIILHTLEGKILDVNKRAQEQFGYGRNEFESMNIAQLHPEYALEILRKAFQYIKMQGYVTFEIDFKKINDEIFPAEVSSSLFEVGGEFIIQGIVRDITERRQSEEKLKASEENYRAIFESVNDAIMIHDAATGKPLDTNPKMVELLGYEKEELAQLKFGDWSTGDPIARQKEAMRRIKEASLGKSQFFEWHVKRKDGRLIWAEINLKSAVIRGEKCVLSVVRDITKRKLAEEALREREEKLRAIFDSAADGIAETDLSGKILKVNKAVLRIYDSDSEENFIGKNALEFFNPLEKMRILKAYRNTYYNSISENNEFEALKIDRTPFPIQMTSSVLRDDGGNPIGFVAIIRDITERKHAENKLRESERKLNTLVNNLPGMAYRCLNDEKYTMKFISRGCKELTGYDSWELIDSQMISFIDVIHPDNREQAKEQVKSSIMKGDQYELSYRIITKDGIIKWVWERGLQVRNELTDEIFLEGIIEDITDKRASEEALRRSEKRFRLASSISTDLIYEWDIHSDVLIWYGGMDEQLGYEPGEILRTIEGWIDLIHPDDAKRLEHSVELQRTSTEPISEEYRVQHKSGEWRDWIDKGTPILDDEGKPYRWIGSCVDVTEKKAAEKRIRESHQRLRNLTDRLQLIREEERATVAREIHDDLGQSLTALKMDLSWLKKNLQIKPDDLSGKIETMLGLTNSLIQTVKRIATELRPGILDDLGLIPAIEWQVDEFQKWSDIQCNLKINGKELTLSDEISVAAFRIFQETLTNIARHSGATRVDTEISINEDTLDLVIKDNGKGIKEEQLSSPLSLGILGMGERVAMLKGKMEITGEQNKGTVVRVTIPHSE